MAESTKGKLRDTFDANVRTHHFVCMELVITSYDMSVGGNTQKKQIAGAREIKKKQYDGGVR